MVQYYVSQSCTAISSTCLVENTIYGYYPSLEFNAFFVAFFAAAAIVHAWLGWRAKTYFFAVMVHIGCIAEAIGYGGRIIMYSNPYSSLGFKMQIACLIFAPAWIAAGIYLTLRLLILTFGESTSALPANFYTPIFIFCDTTSLIMQAVGGGLAGGAASQVKLQGIDTDLMITGVIVQVVTLIAFLSLVVHYAVKTRQHWDGVSAEAKALAGQTRFRLFMCGILVDFMCIFTRCLYRIAEMAGGWANPVMRDEAGFIGAEGFMIVVAVLALTVFHPGYHFSKPTQKTTGSSVYSSLVALEMNERKGTVQQVV